LNESVFGFASRSTTTVPGAESVFGPKVIFEVVVKVLVDELNDPVPTIDSGCPSYSNTAIELYEYDIDAKSTLVVNGIGDVESTPYAEPRMKLSCPEL
jgi:hypothetical protein